MGYRTLLLLIFSTGTLLAQPDEQMITDRPDQTEAPTTVYPGALQVESGVHFITEDIGSENSGFRQETYALPRSLFRIGVVENLELRLRTQIAAERHLVNSTEIDRTWGVDDLWAGFKLQLTEDDGSGPVIGIFSHVVLPTGTEGISDEEVGTTSKVAVAYEFSDRHEVSSNVGYEYLGEGNGDLFYSLVWEVALADNLEIYIEPYGAFEDFEEWQTNADAGVKYYISNNMMLDYAFGLGLDEEMNFHTVGFSFRLPW